MQLPLYIYYKKSYKKYRRENCDTINIRVGVLQVNNTRLSDKLSVLDLFS